MRGDVRIVEYVLYLMKTAVNILIGIILLIITLSFVLVYVNTHPPRYPLHVPPSEYRADYEAVSFRTEDDVLLKGWLIKPPQPRLKMPAIIICHGLGANKSDFTDMAVSLSRRGYLVLTFDFRAHGESGGRRTSLGYHEQKDVTAALRYLLSRRDIDPERIGIFGFSLGGAVAILEAAGTKRFGAVVSDSAFTSLRDQARDAITGFYHLPAFPFLNLSLLGYELYFQTSVRNISPVSVVHKISPAPILIIAGEGDDLIPADNGRKLYQAAKEPKELWIIPNAEHGGTIAAAGREYEKRVGEFFDKHLKQDKRGAAETRSKRLCCCSFCNQNTDYISPPPLFHALCLFKLLDKNMSCTIIGQKHSPENRLSSKGKIASISLEKHIPVDARC